MTKKELRNIYRSKRAALSEHERTKMDDLMLIRFQELSLPFIHTLFSYWPIEENNEPDTHLFTEFLRFRNPEMIVAYPVSDMATSVMTAIATDIDTPFEKASFNLFEPQQGNVVPPESIDAVFVPLLVADTKGYRVGYGMGFYDRYLASCKDECLKIGFSYFEPVEEISDARDFDVPLDICITPSAAYVF